MIPDDSKCVVIGATDPKSIGFEVAWSLLKGGASGVAIVGRDEAKLVRATDLLEEKMKMEGLGHTHRNCVLGVLGNLKKPETMAGVTQKVVDAWGRIDVLVCCGGNGNSEYLGLDVEDPESYRMMQNVAVVSPMFLAEACFPYLSKSPNKHGGTVVMVGSVAANVPWPATAPYNFAMAAKNTMIQTLAFKYRNSNVRVNGVLAGVIHTGALDVMAAKKNQSVESYAALRATAQPLGRNGTPEDVANAVTYLASPASGFTTGELLRVDGGLHLSNWWNKPVMLDQYGNGTKRNK
ncbi:unnamed protein product [Pseudo-nitzschia multistriata]|uniref:NAD(P)-binding protein n=1 Tax=Pseudo-nitzschia multistriata TaxID=183589 RepID=A0A448YUI5_9STRA|nr:unnamed protein product [Pseudo-nitzschia multistriata]